MPPPRLAACVLLAVALLACSGRARVLQAQTPLQKVLSRFFTNAELAAHMRDYARRCSHIATLHAPLGRSVRGVPLLALELSDRPGREEAEPHFKYVANMHGDETGGRQLLLALAEHLCAAYDTSRVARRLVDGVHLWLVPTMNPDGYAAGTRHNANGADLNRNFPDRLHGPPLELEPETAAVMNCTLSRQFTASANLHEGALVANYPWDNTPDGQPAYAATPDDATFRHLAATYAARNPAMRASQVFPGGITNGAAWYSVDGGMQDWNYVAAGCFELTLELWEAKGGADLPELWAANRRALLQLALRSTLGGLRGTVRRRGTRTPLRANITVAGSSTVTRSGARFGDFYRPLAPSLTPYRVKVKVEGFRPRHFSVVIPANGSGAELAVTFP